MTDGLNCQTHTHSVRKCGSGSLSEKREENQTKFATSCFTCAHTQTHNKKQPPKISTASKTTYFHPSHPPAHPHMQAPHPVCIKSNSSPKILIYEHLKSASMRFILKQCYMPTQEGSENRHMIHSSPRSASCLLVLLIGNMWSSSKQPMGALASAFCCLTG